jgi:DNA-binding CsgD family transcriptional regulator
MRGGNPTRIVTRKAAFSLRHVSRTRKGMIRLQSHMAPARVPTDQHSLECARAAVLAFDLIGLAAAALGRTGRPIAVNQRFELLAPPTAKGQGHLHLVSADTDIVFGYSWRDLATKAGCDDACLLPVPAADGRPPLILHVMAVRGAARDRLPGVHAILVAAPVAARDVPPVAILQGLFQMTPAEARVAHGVAQCQTVGDIADSFGLSPETVRSQLKSALAKTGVARKLDLAVVLAGARLPIASDAT